ncbi:sugar phosphate isomerase/epimerase family protein [Candidatus Protofrankia californiensis]|uniref:sugar phosphate isomerase/epimerase family protein n=1 Tax=Candidatus Protofrankia californiensis TaxID=1839754 RepID=UPI0010411CA2|nr:sugar phosphate isomerase/epimerase family protein [Candidatus Protofrankia californiensis]
MNPVNQSQKGRKHRPGLSLHGGTIMRTNVVTAARVAHAAGFDGIELLITKVARYLDTGFSTDDLIHALGPLRVTMLDALLPIETRERTARQQLIDDCARMSRVAADLNCPTLQVVALDNFSSDEWQDQRRVLIDCLTELADVATPHGVRLAIEPVTFSPFHALDQALEVIQAVGLDRVGLCLDTWHLWTSGTPWEEVANLDKRLILAVQIGDTQARTGLQWRDDDRTALPGEGVLPLREAVEAIAATGYDGMWTVEMLSKKHWEWDPDVLALAVLERTKLLFDLHNP